MQKTSERLKDYKHNVVEAWVERVRNQVSIASRTERPQLIDNLPRFIEDLILALKADGNPKTLRASETWEQHAIQRATQTDLTLSDVIREYQLLRSIIFETLWEEGPMPQAAISLINTSVDEAIAKSVAVYEKEKSVGFLREQLLAGIFLKSVPDPFFILDYNWRYVYINERAAQQSHHKTKTELLGKNFWDIHPEIIGTKIQTDLQSAMKEKKHIQFELYLESENEWFSVDCYPNELGLSMFYRDISDRVSMERKLVEQKALLEAVIEKLPAGVRIHDARSGRVIISNAEALRIFGANLDMGSWKDLAKLVVKHEDQTPMHFREYPTIRALFGEKVKDQQMVITSQEGEEKFVLSSACPIWNHRGEITHVVVVTTEIGDLKRVQLELAQSNKDLSIYSASVAHDLKSPINTIAAMTELLKEKNNEKLDSESQEMMNYVVTSARRMQKLIDNLLSYARINEERDPFIPVDLNRVLMDVEANLKDNISQHHAVIEHQGLPEIIGDGVQLTSLFQNLISNAIKFRSKNQPVVRIRASESDRGFLICVQDNGIGFDPRHASHLFEPFTRLHGSTSYEGTGLGLSICRRIVERHKGRIWAESAPGQGTTFFIQFPKLVTSSTT